MKKKTGFQVMLSLIGLVKPLMGFMVLAIAMGLAGHLCAAFLTVLGGYGVAHVLGWQMGISLPMLFGVMILLAVLRGMLRYGEQACNHFIAFKLLALIREKAAAYQELQSSAVSAAKRGYVDDIIEPADTRKRVIAAFEMLFTKREDRPDRKHGTV